MVEVALYAAGLMLFVWRLRQRSSATPGLDRGCHDEHTAEIQCAFQNGLRRLNDLAILVPARNEAHSLPRILESLKSAKDAGALIVVIDDQSSDGTAQVARQFQVSVCSTGRKPDGWSGKNWACHCGYEFLQKTAFTPKFLLFTDADTTHFRSMLPRAVRWAEATQADLLSAPPYHRSPDIWETMLGPFYLMIAFITNAKEPSPTANRVFAIGQFLLFRDACYRAIGGHAAIKGDLAEDLAFAQQCFRYKKRYLVYPTATIYETRMYGTIIEFYRGWSRNFCLGMQKSDWRTWFETFLVFGALLQPPDISMYLLNVFTIYCLQRNEGRFHVVGAIIYPLSLLGFVAVSLNSVYMRLRRRPILWKSREYVQ